MCYTPFQTVAMAIGGAATTFFFLFSVWACLVSQARSLPSPVTVGSNSNATVTNEIALLSFKSMLYHQRLSGLSWNHGTRPPTSAAGQESPAEAAGIQGGSSR